MKLVILQKTIHGSWTLKELQVDAKSLTLTQPALEYVDLESARSAAKDEHTGILCVLKQKDQELWV